VYEEVYVSIGFLYMNFPQAIKQQYNQKVLYDIICFLPCYNPYQMGQILVPLLDSFIIERRMVHALFSNKSTLGM